MFSQTEGVLFAAWTLLALVFAAASLAAALFNRKELARRVPLLFFTIAVLMVPAGFCAGAFTLERFGWAAPLGFLYPPLCLLAAWLQFHSLHESPWPARLMATPVFALDILLGVVWLLRLLEGTIGLDLGTQAEAVSVGYAVLQATVGHPDAVYLPILVHLPLLLPPLREWRGLVGNLVLLGSALPATALLVLWASFMPGAWTIAASYRAPAVSKKPPLRRPDQVFYLRHGPSLWGKNFLVHRKRDRAALEELGAGGVLLAARAEILADKEAWARLQAEASWARAKGMKVILAAFPAEAWLAGRKPLKALVKEMEPFHWKLAEEISPDTLVLWWEPVLLGAEFLASKPHPDQWAEAIRRTAKPIKTAFPKIGLTVCLGSPYPDTRNLLQRISAPDFPVDEVGLSIVPYLAPLDGKRSLEARLQLARDWITLTAGAKPFALLRAGTSPVPVGGEKAQAVTLARILSWAAGIRPIHSVVIHSLANYTEDLGLVTPLGRHRPAYALLRKYAQGR